MKIIIRSEEVKDYSKIANVNYLAFHNWKPDNPFVRESIMVDVLRQHSGFNPELSLVAEVEGKIVGHVLFLQFDFIVMGEVIQGMILGPVAVKPEFQKLGVGKALIETGHKKAEDLGIQISLCCGHDKYYPKFGYKNAMFSLGGVKVSDKSKDSKGLDYKLRNLEEADESFLKPLWLEWHKDDVLAVCPGGNLSDWVNYNEKCEVKIVEVNENPIGYIRYQIFNGLEVKELMAVEGEFINMLNATLNISKGKKIDSVNLLMDMEKIERLVGQDKIFDIENRYSVYDAFMIKSLKENSVVDQYLDKVINKEIKAGVISLTNVYDIEE
ncbi:MAG: GNAT family N-acetyltransferase [Clostridiales bacterium]|nr:GNAT family N-acetyltransferase [Clostridiales bacterium]